MTGSAVGGGRAHRSGLAVAAERSLQGLLVAAAPAVVLVVLVQLRLVVLPVIAALFAATALAPPVRWLRARGLPGAPAALTVMGFAIAAFVGVMAAIVPTIADELGSFGLSAREGLEEVVTWPTAGPLGLSEADIDRGLDQSIDRLRDSGGILAGGVVSGALLVGELVDHGHTAARGRHHLSADVGQSIELHPVVVLLALTTGTVVAGIAGALLAIPVAAVIWIGVSHFRDRRADAAPQ